METGQTKLILASHNEGKLRELISLIEEQAGALEPGAVISAKTLGLEEPAEDGPDFESNALIKARAVFEQTGIPAVADDSGLIVDIMGNAPGVLSARWAGRHGDDLANNSLLLAQLSDLPQEQRRARFVTCCALIRQGSEVFAAQKPQTKSASEASSLPTAERAASPTSGGFCHAKTANVCASEASPLSTEGHQAIYTERGEMPGEIIAEMRGEAGFGYDSIFIPDALKGTEFAGLTSAQIPPQVKNTISHRAQAMRKILPEIIALLRG